MQNRFVGLHLVAVITIATTPLFVTTLGMGAIGPTLSARSCMLAGFAKVRPGPEEGDGTPARVNTALLARYLTQSSHAVIYAQGRLPSRTAAPVDGRSALDRLRLGDLMGYEAHGCLAHFALVVGFDSDGYPLVISPSADRYRVAWDLGWEPSTQYVFFHVRYPAHPEL